MIFNHIFQFWCNLQIYACLPKVSMSFIFYISLPNCPDKNDYSSYTDSIPANPIPIIEGSQPEVFTSRGNVLCERTELQTQRLMESKTTQASHSK